MRISLYTFVFLLFYSLSLFAEQASSLTMLQQAVQQSTKEAKVDALNSLSMAYLENNQLEKANQSANEAHQLAEQLSYQKGLAGAMDVEGLLFQEKFDYTNAMRSFVKALKIRNELDDPKGIAASKNNIGKVFLLQGEVDNAVENLNLALQTRESTQDFKGASMTHQNLGDAYLQKKLYGKAKNHYKRALDLKIQLEDFKGAASMASFLGRIVSDLGDYEGALVYHNMSLDLNSSIEDLPQIANDYNNIAMIYQSQQSYDEAIEANNVAKSIRKELKDKLGLAETYKNLGLIYTELEKEKKASLNLEKSTDLLQELSGDPSIHEIYKAIAGAYSNLGEYKKAYQNHTAYATTKDDFYSQEKAKALVELNTKYESEFAAKEKQQQIEKLELEQASANRIRIFLLALIGLIGLLALNLYTSYRRKKQDNELLMAKNEEIQRQKNEIDKKNAELEEKNVSLDILNSKLVDEMAERESIEKSSFARDSFIATMSHEMRTPMNAIVGMTHLLLEDKPRKDQTESLRTLQFAANNLTVFINDILDFSKIEAGKLTLESREFEPKKIFDEISHRFQRPIEDKGVSLSYQFDERIPDRLIGDPARLNQILNNLVTNAMQSTEEGLVSLNVYLDEYNTKEAVLKIVVSDTGTGLSRAKLEKMFRQFDEQNTDIFEGYERSSLALAITKRLVDLQNGKLEVDTAIGKGTMFTIYIPCKQTAQQTQVVEQKTVEPENFNGYRILIVEDNRINQLVVAKMLKKLGMHVVTADNGQEALKEVNNSDFDLILMDIQMPVMDGYKATAQIRAMQDTKKANIPIIALTASAFLSETEKAKLFGMNDHVGKPFGPEDLLEKITTCVEQQKTQTAS